MPFKRWEATNYQHHRIDTSYIQSNLPLRFYRWLCHSFLHLDHVPCRFLLRLGRAQINMAVAMLHSLPLSQEAARVRDAPQVHLSKTWTLGRYVICFL